MLDIEDEYIRDYSFDPEFIQRKDSLEMHKDHLKNYYRNHEKKLAHKVRAIEMSNSLTEEEIAMKKEKNIVDAEVYSFCTVIRFWVNNQWASSQQ